MSRERSTGGGDLETLGANESAGDSLARGDASADEPRTIGRHRVLNRLGSGGMGVVYAAYDVDLDRRIAIKVVKRRGSARGNARLLREAQALARLSHPNVVQVFEVGTLPADGGVWVAMELVDGRSFGRWRSETQPSWSEVLARACEAGAGLLAAHDAGLVHRDFKPDNVLVADDGRVVVIDFGLARAGIDEPSASDDGDAQLSSSALTQGAILGTPFYMAPEQHAGRTLDSRTDQFAFCVTVWEALYGERPFADDSAARAASAILGGELRAPPAGTGVPEWVHAVLVRGLSSRPDDRWPSMGELLVALASRSRRPRRLIAMAGVGLGAAAIAVAAGVPTRRACDRDDPLAGAWDDARRKAVTDRLAEVAPSWGPDTARRVDDVLDEWSTRWRDTEREACEATRVRGEASEQLMDRRMACLADRRRALAALVEVLADADARTAERAIDAVSGLPRPEPCGDEAHVGSGLEPVPEALAGEVERIRENIARASALEDAGDPAAALALAETALVDALASGYAPLAAEAQALRASVREKAGDFAGAATDAEDAYHAASAIGHDTVALEAARIRSFVALRRHEPEEVRAWVRIAQTAIDRAGGGDLQRAHVVLPLALVEADEGELDRAITVLGEAIAIFEREDGLESLSVASALNNLGIVHTTAGHAAEAEHVLTRSLAIRESLLGPDHPQVGSSMVNLSTAIAMQGRHDDAIAVLRRGAALLERAYDPDHLALAQTRGNLAYLLKERGQTVEAIALLERVAATMERTLGPNHPDLANALGILGSTHADARQWAAAHEHLSRALAILDAQGIGDRHSVGATLQDLVTVLTELDRRGEARTAAERLVALLEKEPGEKAPLAAAKFALARLLDDAERARALAGEARALYASEAGTGDAIAELDEFLASRAR